MAGYGYGKVILFGEHFVVHGLPGIAGGIGSKTTAEAEKSREPGLHITDDRPAVPGYKTEKSADFNSSLEYIKKAVPQIDWSKQGVKIRLAGDLVAASGVGASAAACAAIARGIDEVFGLKLNDEQINKIAYEGEKGYHGDPSGLDNTCATYGTLITFTRRPEGNKMDKLLLDKSVEIVMANTGVVADTKGVVAGVRERKEKEPEKYAKIFKEYEAVYNDALKALKACDWHRVAQLMDKNQELLRQIGVSHPKLEEFITVAKKNGALSAKLTGGGMGGYMFALTPGKELQDGVYNALKPISKVALKATIGGK